MDLLPAFALICFSYCHWSFTHVLISMFLKSEPPKNDIIGKKKQITGAKYLS